MNGNPQGTVSVNSGSTALCTSNLTASGANAATFSCALTASQLNVGTYSNVVAVFTPATSSSSNSGFTYSGSTSSPAQSFSVNPASEATTTSLNAVTSPITYGSETTETFTGTVTGQSGDGYPQGTLSVQSGATVLCSETLPAGTTDVASFSCSPTSGTLLAASTTPYPVTATFTPATTSSSNTNFTYTGSTSTPAQNLTVNSPTTSTNNLKIQMLGLPEMLTNAPNAYLIAVTNQAKTATTGTLTVTDVLPTGLKLQGALVVPSGFKCVSTSSANTLTCTSTKAIDAHGVVYIAIGVSVTARAGSAVTNTVTLSPVGTPSSNYTASVTSEVIGHQSFGDEHGQHDGDGWD